MNTERGTICREAVMDWIALIDVAILIVLTAALLGCDRSGGNGDDGTDGNGDLPVVGAFHAVPDLGQVTFLREEEEWTAIDFGNGTDFRGVGADQYDFNFDALLPGDEATSCTGDNDGDDVKDEDECTRLTSVSLNVLRNHEYTVVLAGTFAAPEVLVYDRDRYKFDTSDSDGDPKDEVADVHFMHLAQNLGQVDVYIERPGTNLSPVQARAALGPREDFGALIAKGEYVITLTAVGDPSTVLFTSGNFTLDSRTRVAFAIRDGAGTGTSPIVVTVFRERSGTLVERFAPTELRVAQVAPFTGNVDVFVGGDFAAPFAADLGFTEVSAYKEVERAQIVDLDVDATPAGNPGVFLTREQIDLVAGERSTFFLLGGLADLDGLRSTDTVRRLATFAQLRLVNGAGAELDFFVVPRGSNIQTLSPTVSLSTRQSAGFRPFAPDDYDIVLTKRASTTALFGPQPVELRSGGVYTVVATNTGEVTSVSVELLDDFAN